MPRWKELKKYLDKNGWELIRSTDHYYYQKVNIDGSTYFTKVSRGSGEISKSTFKYILSHQLHISKEEFNKGSK